MASTNPPAGTYLASDGRYYPLPAAAPPPPPAKRRLGAGATIFLVVVATAALLALIVGLTAGPSTPADPCEALRSALLEAKRDRQADMSDSTLMGEVANRANEARAEGCETSDLIADSVG